jgi:hypothetical protein
VPVFADFPAYLHSYLYCMRNLLLFILTGLLYVTANAQPKTDAFLKDLLAAQPDSLLQAVLNQPDSFRYQIIYTKIDRDKNNKPVFTHYYYNVDRNRYFNPASVVKMPLAFLSLEKLYHTSATVRGINKYTSMQFDSGWHRQTRLYKDSTSENGLPSIAQFIRKAFLISDNDAYNRMYEYFGQQWINRRLHQMGYPDIRITRRFMRMNAEENRHTNPIRFIKEDGRLIHSQPGQYNTDSFDFSRVNKMGRAHLNANDSLINTPIDFTTANNFPLEDMQQVLQSVMFPGSSDKQPFNLSKDDYAFLYRYLSQYPSETSYPKYDTSEFYDSYVKFFFRNPTHKMPEGVRVFNKVGWAYGCLTDVSYVADFNNKVEFMLSATIYVNADGVLNDNKYEYTSVGWPFLYKLGQTIYQYELKRERKYKPNLSSFKIKYQLRPEDGRKAIKDADN